MVSPCLGGPLAPPLRGASTHFGGLDCYGFIPEDEILYLRWKASMPVSAVPERSSLAPDGSRASPNTAWRIDSAELALGFYLLAFANGVAADIAVTLSAEGLHAVFGLFGVDPVVLAACAVGFLLTLRARPAGCASWAELSSAVAAALVVLLPLQPAGWAGAGVFAGYCVVSCRRKPALQSASLLFLMVSVYEVWGGKLALNLFAPALMAFDASIANALLRLVGENAVRTGNVISLSPDYNLVIVGGCLSLGWVLLGILSALTFIRAVRPLWRLSEVWIYLAVGGSVIALNAVRLTLYGLDVSFYEYFHEGPGRPLFGLLVVGSSMALAAFGVRDEFRNRPSRR